MPNLSETLINLAVEQGQNAVKKAFTAAKFGEPVITLEDGASDLNIVIVGKSVDADGEFTVGFLTDYWQGTLILTQKNPIFSADVLSVTVVMKHTYDVHRTANDKKNSNLATIGFVIDASGATGSQTKSEKSIVDSQDVRASHPVGHSDAYKVTLTADLKAGTTANNIERWQLEITAQHLDKPRMAMAVKDPNLLPEPEPVPGRPLVPMRQPVTLPGRLPGAPA